MTWKDKGLRALGRATVRIRISLSRSLDSDWYGGQGRVTGAATRQQRSRSVSPLQIQIRDNGHLQQEIPRFGALGADPASLGKVAERRQEHRTAAIAGREKFGKLEC